MASQEIEALSQALARLPGLGPRSARRAVLHLMKKRETALQPLLTALQTVSQKLSTCSTCGNVDTSDPCSICRDPRRDEKSLCVVEEVADLWALDRSRLFPGRYHVLGGRLSALEGVRPEDLAIDTLVGRVAAGGIEEVVLAMNATLEGQTTAHYLAERLERRFTLLHQVQHRPPRRARPEAREARQGLGQGFDLMAGHCSRHRGRLAEGASRAIGDPCGSFSWAARTSPCRRSTRWSRRATKSSLPIPSRPAPPAAAKASGRLR